MQERMCRADRTVKGGWGDEGARGTCPPQILVVTESKKLHLQKAFDLIVPPKFRDLVPTDFGSDRIKKPLSLKGIGFNCAPQISRPSTGIYYF